MALRERVQKSKAGARFAKTLSRDRFGRAREVLVPGSKGKRYHVLLKRLAKGLIMAECFCDAGAIGMAHCRCTSTVCYHIITAIMHAAKEKGFVVLVPEKDKGGHGNEANARRLVNLHRGARLMRVISRNAPHAEVWVVVTK